MELMVKGKFEYQNSYGERLKLKIKFKLPGKFFKVKLEKTLTTTTTVDVGWMTYEEFQEKTLYYLREKDYLERVVVNMVEDYLHEESVKKSSGTYEQQVKDLLKNSGFNIKVKIK